MLNPTTTYTTYRVNKPEWFQNPEFVALLNDPNSTIATWHVKGQPVGEYSDVLLDVSDGWSGVDLPEDIQKEITEFWESINCPEMFVLWVANIKEEEDAD